MPYGPEMPGSPSRIPLAVVGAHLEGQPLHHQLSDRGAVLLARTTTAPSYRLFALDTVPPKPGLVRTGEGESGAAVEVEVYELDAAGFGTFVAEVPPPLAIGTLTLADGTEVPGFVCEPYALDGAPDITEFGGWRAYLASRS
jgi:allophanate hydrolase